MKSDIYDLLNQSNIAFLPKSCIQRTTTDIERFHSRRFRNVGT